MAIVLGKNQYAADRTYGLIEASVIRDDLAEPVGVWEGINGFV